MTNSSKRRPLDVLQIPLFGLHLIEASAGTGKTYTITSLVVRLVVEREIPIESILAVTFTNAATAELKDRVARRLVEARDVVRGDRPTDGDPLYERLLSLPDRQRAEQLLSRAVIEVDRAGVLTIHGFAARMLREHSFESGAREGTELSGDARPVVHDVVTDFWSSRVATLSESEFRAVGGSSFYRALRSVGMQAAGAPEVTLVESLDEGQREEAHARLREIFDNAKASFAAQGEALLERLVEAPGLNRNQMKVESLRRDYTQYVAYFEAGAPGVGHPSTERFTQTKVLAAAKKGAAPLHDPLLALLEELLDRYKGAQKADSLFADGLRLALCREISDRMQAEHFRSGTQSFDGILLDLAHALREPKLGERLAREIRAEAPVALIDEFQDTDPLQYEIFSRIYAAPSPSEERASALYLIGDPKQSIYAFRGADIRTYLAAAERAASSVWTLVTSFRASPRLIAAQNALFSGARRPFGTEAIIYDDVSARPGAEDELCDDEGHPLPGIQLIEFSGSSKEVPEAIAQEVAAFLAGNPRLADRVVTPGDIAVLTRTNLHAAQVQEALRELRIPAVLHGDRSVFEAPEALELRRILRALAEPAHRSLFRTALSTRTIGFGAVEFQRLDEDTDELEHWSGLFRAWGELWRKRGVAPAISALHASVAFQARTLRALDGERRVTNFRHLMELLHDAESRQHLGVSGLLRWLDGAIFDPDSHGMADEARQLRLESDADAVTLTTAHRSKGLEYNVVFLPSLSDAERKSDKAEAFRYFDRQADAPRFEMRAWENRGESNEWRRREGQEEALRLAYVALTRAKHHAVVFCTEAKSFSALSYFLHEAHAPEPDTEVVSLYLKGLDSSVRRAQIQERCARSSGTLRLSFAVQGAVEPYTPGDSSVTIIEPEAVPPLVESERTNSFSSMTRDAHQRLSRAAQEGHDVDEGGDADDLVEGALGQEEPKRLLTESTLSDFPRGAGPGDALHAAYEFCGFADLDAEARAAAVARELSKRAFSEEHIEALQRNVEEVLRVPLAMKPSSLGFSPCTLGSLKANARVAEMEFSFAVGSPERRLSVARLARSLGFEDDEFAPPQASRLEGGLLSAGYLKAVHELSFSAWCGFLRGFIDLVFVHEGRLYGLDYKSNFLGPHREDYVEEKLRGAMEEHHYFLQAIFYAVAIHRYGKSRMPDYDFERHFGGMHYLFVRGMHPDHGPSGVYSFRPTLALIERVEAALSVESNTRPSGEAA